jgi:hypothetical protein
MRHPRSNLWKFTLFMGVSQISQHGDEVSTGSTPASAHGSLYQTAQKGEVELPRLIRKWRMKGEETFLPRGGNGARELCISGPSIIQKMPGTGHVSSVGVSGGKSQCYSKGGEKTP